jgi:RNA polymerase sigma factor (sigma-70 family)
MAQQEKAGCPELTAVLDNCLRRVGGWRGLPHWSRHDWMKEMRAESVAAAWQAVREYDPSRGIPFNAFAYQRVMTRVLKRYRQEWAYFVHYCCETKEESLDRPKGMTKNVIHSTEANESLYWALALLPDADVLLLEQLFWKGCTELEIAEASGISQSAVSQRKRAILARLRGWLDGGEEKKRKSSANAYENGGPPHIHT